MSHSERSIRTDRGPPSSRRDRERSLRDTDNHWDGQRRDRELPRDRPHRDGRSHQSDRGERDQKLFASNGRPLPQGPPRSQHSRPPTVHSEPYSRPPVSTSHMYSSPSRNRRPEKQSFSEKCSNLCSRRGLLQLVELLLNLLVLICAASTESASAGFASIGGLGGPSYYNMGYQMNGFQGDEVAQVTDLDMQYSKMKMPTVYCMVGLSIIFLALTLSFLAVNCMSGFDLRKLLMAEAGVALLCAVVYIVCIGLYIHFIQWINGTDVCKQREALYVRRGYNSVSCDILGTEVAVCVFAVLAIAAYIASAVITGLRLKEVLTIAQTPMPRGSASVFKSIVRTEEVPMKTDMCQHVGKDSSGKGKLCGP